MADRPVVNGVARLAVSGTYENEPWVNVFHFWDLDAVAPVSPVELIALQADLNTSGAGGTARTFFQGIYSLMDSGLVATAYTLESYDGPSSSQLVGAISVGGTSGGTNIAPFNAALIKWSNGTIDRHFKGRTYLSGLNNGMTDTANTDQLDGTFRGNLATRMQQVVNGVIATTDFAMCVFSRELAEPGLITNITVDETVAIQRRRRTSS